MAGDNDLSVLFDYGCRMCRVTVFWLEKEQMPSVRSALVSSERKRTLCLSRWGTGHCWGWVSKFPPEANKPQF